LSILILSLSSLASFLNTPPVYIVLELLTELYYPYHLDQSLLHFGHTPPPHIWA
jgi:hypothetical protein